MDGQIDSCNSFLWSVDCCRSKKPHVILWVKTEMLILQTYKFLENVMGLHALHNRGHAIRASLISCSISISILFTFVNLIENVSDFAVAIESFCIICGYLCLFPVYLHMIFNRVRFELFLDELTAIVNESNYDLSPAKNVWKRLNSKTKLFLFRTGIKVKQVDSLYAATEQKIAYLTKISMAIAASSSTLYLLPFIRVAYHWILGIYTIDSWFFMYRMR